MQEKACRRALPQCSGDNVGNLLEPEAVMPNPTSKSPAKMIEVALVLQGGGALGAYEYCGITALFDLMDQAATAGHDITLRVVTGVSIGAINAACIVGAENRAEACQQLGALWNDLNTDDAPFLPPWMDRDASLVSVPHFCTLRSDLFSMPCWTYLYDTHPMLEMLSKHIKFNILNSSKTAFVITTVDVESGLLTRFANQKVGETKPTPITARHVLASGSLPPQFPWTEIGDGAK